MGIQRFKNVKLNATQLKQVSNIRRIAIELEKEITKVSENGIIPVACGYLEQSLLELEITVMLANKAISRNSDYIK